MISLFYALAILQAYSKSFQEECKGNYVPLPHKCQTGIKSLYISNPCTIAFLINIVKNGDDKSHFEQLLRHYQNKLFGCYSVNIIQNQMYDQGFQFYVKINVEDGKLQSALQTKQQRYSLTVQQTGNATINSQHYVGFVRGIQAWSQTINQQRKHKKNLYKYQFLPVEITDQPQFKYRGIMVDTARHYLPFDHLLKTADSLMYNKMNILHWHITDQDSFPLVLKSHPQIAEFAAFSQQEVYSVQQVKKLVRYAMIRGVRIIPQLDTPGHAASWGKSPQLKDIACTFGKNSFMGPLDVTLSLTYKVVEQVFRQINQLFPDPVIHLGGDEVSLTCKRNATQFFEAEQIKNEELQIFYRKRQREIIKKINPDKIAMYWMNNNIVKLFDQRDIVHWWGGNLPRTKNPIVISYYGRLYLDMGVGNYYGNNYGSYSTWLTLYNLNYKKEIENYQNKQNVLGAQGPLWSQSSNQHTHFQKLWTRSSSIAERTWTSKDTRIKPDVLRRFTAQDRRLKQRGIPTSPITSQQCQFHAQYC